MNVLTHPESPSTTQSRAPSTEEEMKVMLFQRSAASTSKFKDAPPRDLQRILIATLGLNGEAGEFTETIKHWLGHEHDLDINNVKEELGDLLWYVSELATAFEFELGDIMSDVLRKLARRYPAGFSTKDSVARADKK